MDRDMIATVEKVKHTEKAAGVVPFAVFEDVGKAYPVGILGRRRIQAVDHVGFDLRPGEVFGLLGPNRAGKTTLVKLLLSLCRADSGYIYRFGRPAAERRTLSRVGYMHENHAFPRYLSAKALLEYYGAMSLIPFETLRDRVPTLLQRFGLADRSHEPISNFSKGMVQRLGLAQALLTDPDLLVLDEPTEGLDLDGRQLLRAVMNEQRERGRSVLLVSHVLTEVEQICDRVTVLVGGQVAFVGPLTDLVHDPSTGEARSLEAVLQDLYKLPT
jgi:ABC-2 type transport system ATP-binding protein